MHGKNSQENREKLVGYYDGYVSRQKKVGVNLRHQSISDKIKAHGLSENARVLEIGCGIGTFSSLLAKLIPNGKAHCVDISPESIEEANKIYGNLTNLEFSCKNAVEGNFGDLTFDAVILPDVIEHIPIEEHKSLFSALSQVIKPNGVIYIHIPNPYYLEWCHTHFKEGLQIIDQPIFTHLLVENIIDFGLFIEHLQTYSIWVEDGDYQFIVLRKNGFQDFSKQIDYAPSFLDKIKYKLNGKQR